MSKKNRNYLILIVVSVIAALLIVFLSLRTKAPGRYDAFARCLKEQGAIFYGAFWCPHCQNQKALFGASAQYLPYVECSTPDSQGQVAVCAQNNIGGYPTWVFKDGSRLTGETSLADLAAKSGCSLPQ